MSWLFGSRSSKSASEEEGASAGKGKNAESSPFRRARADAPTFTSSKFPPGPGLENSCELPFGLIWTPMAESEDHNIIKSTSSALPPVLCLSCLTYLNKYCDVNRDTGIWKCALCDSENALPKKFLDGDALLEPALTSNQVEFHQPIPSSEADADEMCTLILLVDRNLDNQDGQAIFHAVKSVIFDLGEDHPGIQLGLVAFDATIAMYQLASDNADSVASADMYAVQNDEDDETRQKRMEEQPYLKTIKSIDDLKSLSVGLSALFSSGKPSKAADQIGGEPSRLEVLKKRKEERTKQTDGPSPLVKESPWLTMRNVEEPKRCTGEALECAMDLASVRMTRTSRILLFTNGCPNTDEGTVVAEKEKEKQTKSFGGGRKKKQAKVNGGQMTKAIEYYDTLATLAADAGIAVDIFCAGWLELGLPAYQAIVAPSGGYVIPHSDFQSPHLIHNLQFLMKHTFISRTNVEFDTGGDSLETPKKGLGRFFRRKTVDKDDSTPGMSQCIVDIRTDSFVTPTHLVGPGEVLNAGASKKKGISRLLMSEKAAFAEGVKLATAQDISTKDLPITEALDLSLTRARIPRVDPLATVSVMLQVNKTMVADEDKFSFIQVTARFISRDGTTVITRVSTHRLPVAASVRDYVCSVDDEVISVLLAKSAVYRSMYGREETEDTKDKVVAGDPATLEKLAYEAQLDLDATIQRISSAFRLVSLEEKTKEMELKSGGEEKRETFNPASSLDLAFPPELAGCLHRLYHLRRGALISPGPLQSMDDRAGVRQLFLRFTLDDCLGMMAPKLWSTEYVDSNHTVASMMKTTPFPAETMALWDAVSSESSFRGCKTIPVST